MRIVINWAVNLSTPRDEDRSGLRNCNEPYKLRTGPVTQTYDGIHASSMLRISDRVLISARCPMLGLHGIAGEIVAG